MHFHLVLMVHSLLKSSCLPVRKATLVHEERPHGEVISSTETPDITETSNIPSPLCLV